MVNQNITISPSTIKKFNEWKTRFINGDYRAYIQAHKSNKFSRRHVTFCPIEQQIQDALSDGEHRSYKVLRADPKTVSIKMQFALDLDETLELADRLHVKHPCDWKTHEAYVMTTDLVVTHLDPVESSSLTTTAYTFKYWDKVYRLNSLGQREKISPRTWQKFAIEKVFWNRRDIQYRLITERDATKSQAWNIDFCRLARNMKVVESDLLTFLDSFEKHWSSAPYLTLSELVTKVAQELRIEFRSAMQLFRYGVLNRYITVDQSVELQPYHRVLPGSHESLTGLIGEKL